MAQCVYKYSDGSQCVISSLPEGRKLCTDHRILVQRKIDAEKKRRENKKEVEQNGIPAAIRRPPRTREKFSQPSRVTSAAEVVDKLPEAPRSARLVARVNEIRDGRKYGDPSAPWCTCRYECDCNKPSYNVWWRGVGERKRS